MRQALGILIVVALCVAGFKFYQYAQKTIAESQQRKEATDWAPGKVPGLRADLEPSLAQAKKEGADGLRQWLARHRHEVERPRLTEIELDYVVLAGPTDRDEARRVLAAVRQHIKPDSPVYPRFQQLDRAYGQ